MLVFICIGVYSSDNNVFDVYIVLIFGIIGYFMRRFDYPAAPLLLGFILGPLLDENFRWALLLGRGNPAIFLERPISLIFVILNLLFLVGSFLPVIKRVVRRSEDV